MDAKTSKHTPSRVSVYTLLDSSVNRYRFEIGSSGLEKRFLSLNALLKKPRLQSAVVKK
jgi:hypothetical protein